MKRTQKSQVPVYVFSQEFHLRRTRVANFINVGLLTIENQGKGNTKKKIKKGTVLDKTTKEQMKQIYNLAQKIFCIMVIILTTMTTTDDDENRWKSLNLVFTYK